MQHCQVLKTEITILYIIIFSFYKKGCAVNTTAHLTILFYSITDDDSSAAEISILHPKSYSGTRFRISSNKAREFIIFSGSDGLWHCEISNVKPSLGDILVRTFSSDRRRKKIPAKGTHILLPRWCFPIQGVPQT